MAKRNSHTDEKEVKKEKESFEKARATIQPLPSRNDPDKIRVDLAAEESKSFDPARQ